MVLWRGKTKPFKRWPVSCKMLEVVGTFSNKESSMPRVMKDFSRLHRLQQG
ncbi:hypothetical protein ES319_D03G108100v1 [Gossypium barbadense]|uniref:Uncharacterized protein n=2 Tax=Gossypium TaxID=3633 RepID=A0A5J5SA87_GOSBA|nr:hypothetical protein ES319_D03G108100v1 [Gossypium barbadense]TYG76478.1 hypothetical protein ES288_D03G117300v1 [Gossypium darwinii]